MLASLLPLLTLTVGACDPEPTDLDTRDEAADVTVDVEPAVDAVAAADAPRLVRAVQLSDTHVVNFWVLENGAGLVQEEFHADLDDGAVIPKDGVQRTFAEMHRLVLPAEEVPADVLEVDELTAAIADEQPAAQDDAAAPPAGPDAFSAAEPEASAACGAWDWANDAVWFFQNYCVGGNHQDCVANWTAVNSWRHAVSWFSTRVFNQSMEAPAQVKVGHQNCYYVFPFSTECEWLQDHNYPLGNRLINEWHSTGPGRYYVDIVGSGPCARVGMAQLWNTKSEGGGGNPNPQPNPNPAGPCNYIGEACCAYQNVAGFYCNADYDYALKCNGGACGH